MCNCEYHRYPSVCRDGKLETPTFVRLCVRDKPLPIVAILCNTGTCRIRISNGGSFTSSLSAANHAFRVHSNTIAPSDHGDTMWTVRIGQFDIRLSDLKPNNVLHTTRTPISSVVHCTDVMSIENVESLALPHSVLRLLADHSNNSNESKRQKSGTLLDTVNHADNVPDSNKVNDWTTHAEVNTWNTSVFTDFVCEHPEKAPKLLEISGYMPTKMGNPFIQCTFEHPGNKDSVEVLVSSTLMFNTPKYSDAFQSYWRRIESNELNLE